MPDQPSQKQRDKELEVEVLTPEERLERLAQKMASDAAKVSTADRSGAVQLEFVESDF